MLPGRVPDQRLKCANIYVAHLLHHKELEAGKLIVTIEMVINILFVAWALMPLRVHPCNK